MTKLQTETPAGVTPAGSGAPERWLAVYVLAAFGFLVVCRYAFREFIPR